MLFARKRLAFYLSKTMSFLQGFFGTQIIISIVRGLISLLKSYWIRLFLFCLYLYHSFVNRLFLFYPVETSFILIFGPSARFVLVGIWFIVELLILISLVRKGFHSKSNIYFKLSMLVLLPLATFFICDIPRNFNKRFVKTTVDLNLRTKASMTSEIINKIPRRSTLQMLEDHESWKQVVYKSDTGFVSSKYVYALQ